MGCGSREQYGVQTSGDARRSVNRDSRTFPLASRLGKIGWQLDHLPFEEVDAAAAVENSGSTGETRPAYPARRHERVAAAV